jgi:small subunit ribosomal protein S35
MRGISRVPGLRLYSLARGDNQPLYLNPHKWHGLPADQIFELHQLRKESMGEKYNPSDDERLAIFNTINALSKTGPALDYVYEIDKFKERYMNNVSSTQRDVPPRKSNTFVINDGSVPHKARRLEHLTRVSAYEMPLLAKYRQQYQPKSNKETPLKLTYQSDLSDESNAFNRKVVLTVDIDDLDLNDKQQHKFKLLAGSKFNFNTNVFKLKCDDFEEPTQNARYVVDTFNKLLTEAKDLKEDFGDIPLDKRHMKNNIKKPVPQFPEAWKRPQDAPVTRHKVVNRLTTAAITQRDQQYIDKYSP